jgi:hypothetical protein
VAEHSLGKGEVVGPIPAMGTIIHDKDSRLQIAPHAFVSDTMKLG